LAEAETIKKKEAEQKGSILIVLNLFRCLAADIKPTETPKTPEAKPMTELEKRRAELEKSKQDKAKLEGIYKLFQLISSL
jgi:hypothetical protein